MMMALIFLSYAQTVAESALKTR